ncbi:hypothetical protein U1Q18_048653 [Sarracenia purpurea var. burkii]
MIQKSILCSSDQREPQWNNSNFPLLEENLGSEIYEEDQRFLDQRLIVTRLESDNAMVEPGHRGLIPGSCKIRKRGCSSSSSTSSVLQNYRFKRAIMVGKARGSRLRSNTPILTWRTAAARLRQEAAEATKYTPSQSGGGRSRPVSARKLAATLWEMNEVLSPRGGEDVEEEEKKLVKKEVKVREREREGERDDAGV